MDDRELVYISLSNSLEPHVVNETSHVFIALMSLMGSMNYVSISSLGSHEVLVSNQQTAPYLIS